MSRTPQQHDAFKKASHTYGGDLLKRRRGRVHGRPVSIHNSMHFVLRSTQAKGTWSFTRHRQKIHAIVDSFAAKYGVKMKSLANVGNHLHLHLQLTNRHAYTPFIRAITSAIMMAVTGASRWNKIKLAGKFWDRRPFSRIVVGFRAMLSLRDYIRINMYEGWGHSRDESQFLVAWEKIEKQI
jgi:REP element-mobilizing transposase RayT